MERASQLNPHRSAHSTSTSHKRPIYQRVSPTLPADRHALHHSIHPRIDSPDPDTMPQDAPSQQTPSQQKPTHSLQRRTSSRPPLSSSSSFSSSSLSSLLSSTKRPLSARDVATMKLFQQTQLDPPKSERTPLCRSVGIAIQRPHLDRDVTAGAADQGQSQDRRAPFRRSHSKPENPTSNMGARAIEESSRATAHNNGKKLIFMRNFSVSEEDVVVCNRVRSGVNPTTLRQRSAQDRRYLRSLSVEESRLTATRRRANASNTASPEQHEKRKKTLVVREDESLTMMTIDPTPDALKAISRSASNSSLLMSPRKISSLRNHVEVALLQKSSSNKKINTSNLPEEEPESAVRLDSSKLTPREKAMHGRYLIRESFANGSYGKVCAGEAVASHQEVAVKIVPKYVLISPEEKQSVIREQIIHKSLDHPHIIKLIDVFEDEGAHYFILERADNGSLSTIISYSGLPETRCREVFKQLLLALEYLHWNNIVHHDIKPHNILLKKGNGIKLCDFGASRAFNKNETSLPFAGVFGTPGYIAPELLMGDATYGPAIDIFSAGVLLFEMVFGYAPFYPPSSCTYMPLEFPRNSTVSAQAKHLLGKLLHRDPAMRLTASQALAHPWVTLGASGCSALSSPVTSPRNLAIPRTAW